MRGCLRSFKMGCKHSKIKEYEREQKIQQRIRNSVVGNARDSEDTDGIIDSVNIYERQLIEILQRDLTENPEMLVFNNVLMCVQFFENYQRDIISIIHDTTSDYEKEVNKRLLQDESMECTCPDIILEKVSRNVRYRPMHGEKKYYSEPLASKRIYVMHDRIEVVNSDELPQYTSIDKPSHHVRIEETTKSGYVKLKYVDSSHVADIIPKRSESPQPCSSKSSDSGVYDYNTITDLRTPKPLERERPQSRDSLPERCFTVRTVKKRDVDVDLEDDDVEHVEVVDFYDSVTYVSSKGFMNYFKNVLFPNSLGRALGFDAVEIEQATSIPGKIFCNFADEDNNPSPCEIIPSVSIPWPSEQTFEFVTREGRPTVTDLTTGTRYRWPTDEMIKEMQSMNCVVVPTGHWLKRGKNPDVSIEWEIAFPKADRYLEARMNHAQIKCYLFLLAIHKSFIEPLTRQNGLLAEHIRNHMYWECENNYRDWPEHRLGSKIRKVMTNLKNRLAWKIMPHYFIKKRNLFDNIPNKYLHSAHRIFHEILQFPIFYFLQAVRNLRYTTGKFYSTIDCREVHKIITMNNLNTAGIINPLPLIVIKKNFRDADTKMTYIKDLRRRQKIIKILQEREKESKKLEEQRRGSLESLEMEWTCEKQLDIYKTRSVLLLFMKAFVDISEDSARMGNPAQAQFYLKQAWYHTKVMALTCPAFRTDVEEYEEIIRKAEETYKKQMAKEFTETAPATPIRNSIKDFNQQVKTNVINLTNLHNSYSQKEVPARPLVLKSALAKRRNGNEDGKRKSIKFVEMPTIKATTA